jgi:hypothetical protein
VDLTPKVNRDDLIDPDAIEPGPKREGRADSREPLEPELPVQVKPPREEDSPHDSVPSVRSHDLPPDPMAGSSPDASLAENERAVEAS